MAEQNINIKIDTFIDRGNGNINYANEEYLSMWRVRNSPSFMGIFLQADIPTFINKEIVSATFRMYNKKKTNQATAGLAQYNISGSIAGLTANIFDNRYLDSAIAWSPTEIKPNATVEENAEWMEWDITSILKNNLGKNNVVLAVYDVGNVSAQRTNWSFVSSEGGKTPYINVVYNNAVPDLPKLLYPNGDVIEKGGSITFRWKYNSLYDNGQTKFELGWRRQGETTWNTIVQNSPAETYIMDSAAFPLGVIEWKLQTYNANNAASGYVYGTFELTGRPASPIITEIKNDAITRITWKCNQAENAVYRIKLIKGGEVIHDSGELAGGIKDFYVPNIMLSDGEYTVKMKIGSIYGIWSDESAKVFTLSTPKPQAPSISVSAADTAAVITTDAAALEKFVFRAEGEGDFVLIARFSGDTYTDYTVKSGVRYCYFVRAYHVGYADSAETSIKVNYSGALLAEVGRLEQYIQIRRSTDDWYIPVQRKFSHEAQLIAYSGRNYKVKESGVRKEETLGTTFYLNNKDAGRMNELYERNGVYLIRSGEFCFCCEITEFSLKNALFERGKQVDLLISRVSYDLGVRFDD